MRDEAKKDVQYYTLYRTDDSKKKERHIFQDTFGVDDTKIDHILTAQEVQDTLDHWNKICTDNDYSFRYCLYEEHS